MAIYSYQTRKALEKRLEELTKDYEAVQKRLGRVTDAVEEERLKRRANDLELEIKEIEDNLRDDPPGGPSRREAEMSPFKGLEPFSETDAHLFYGRSKLTAQLLAHLSKHNFLAVVGASGSGKSSVVRAGIIPKLKTGQAGDESFAMPEGSSHWPIHIFTPDAHPLESLALSLTRETETTEKAETLRKDMLKNVRSLHLHARQKVSARKDNGRFLLVVDQFEELFTRCRDEVERKAFIDNLLTAVHPDTAGPIIIIIIIRSDFVHRFIPYKELYQLIRDHEQLISEMSEDELREAIEQPAFQSGLQFSPGLVDHILSDLRKLPAPLPSLSHALYETWLRREGNELTFQGYVESSKVQRNRLQTRMLDAAIAREVVLGIPTELVAQVRLKSSPGLKGILELDIDYDPQPEDVKSRSVQLEFPLDEQQRLQGIFLLLKVASHDFKPPAQTKKIIVPPDADSEPCIFQLIPLRAGQLGLLLEVYDTGEVVTASTKIRVNCQENQAAVIVPGNRILISLPLATTVRPFNEIEQEALQKRLQELFEEYKVVMAQMGYESDSTRIRLERKANAISDEIKKIEQQLGENSALPANIGEHHEVIYLLRQAIMAMENGEFYRAKRHLQELQTSWANPQISQLRNKVVENERQIYDLLMRGAAAHEANDYQKAIHSLQAALSIKPDDIEIQVRLAHIKRYYELFSKGQEALKSGFYQDAVRNFEMALSIESGDSEVQTALKFAVLMRDGKDALEVQNYRQAMGMLHRAISIKPDHEDALALLAKIKAQFEPLLAEGQSSLEANDFRQAVEKLSQALSIRPDHQEARADLEFAWLLVDGEEALESKEYKRAVNIFEQALSIKPYHRGTHINQRFASLLADGEIALEANNYQQAIANFHQALFFKPDHQDANTDLRFAYLLANSQTALEAENYRYAIYQLNEALSIKPGHVYTLVMLSKVDDLINSLLVEAQTALETMNYQQAIEKFDQVLSVKPDYQEAQNDQQFASLLFQGQKALEDENYRQAIYLLNKASSIKPDHEYAVTMLARVYDRFNSLVSEAQTALEAKDYQQAVDRFNRAITIKPDHQEVQDSLRLALSNLDRSREKRTHLLAQVDRLIAAGDFHQALQLCKDTIELNPDDVEFVLRVRRAEDGLARQARWRRNLFLLLGVTIIFLIIFISIFLIARGIGQ